jgi:hypothetical protein
MDCEHIVDGNGKVCRKCKKKLGGEELRQARKRRALQHEAAQPRCTRDSDSCPCHEHAKRRRVVAQVTPFLRRHLAQAQASLFGSPIVNVAARPQVPRAIEIAGLFGHDEKGFAERQEKYREMLREVGPTFVNRADIELSEAALQEGIAKLDELKPPEPEPMPPMSPRLPPHPLASPVFASSRFRSMSLGTVALLGSLGFMGPALTSTMTIPVASTYRGDGWPLCPGCQKDGLRSHHADSRENIPGDDKKSGGYYCKLCTWRGRVLVQEVPEDERPEFVRQAVSDMALSADIIRKVMEIAKWRRYQGLQLLQTVQKLALSHGPQALDQAVYSLEKAYAQAEINRVRGLGWTP